MSFIFKKIDHIQLAAPRGSEEKAREFFSGILGFIEVEKPEILKKKGGVWFEYNGCHVHIGIEEAFAPAKKAHPAFQVEGLEDLKEHLAKNEIDFVEDTDLPGANRIYINDPFDNRIEILEWI